MCSVVLKALLAVAAVLLVAFAVLAVNGGDIAKTYLQNHSQELIGRELSIGDLDLSLLRGAVRIDKLCVKEDDGVSDFLTLDSAYVDMRLLDLLVHNVYLQHIHLHGANVAVDQNGDRFNFTSIIEHFSKPDSVVAEKDTTPSDWTVSLNDIVIDHCGATYRDVQLGSKFQAKDLSVVIPGIYFSDKSTDVGLDLRFDQGGELTAKMVYDIASGAFDIKAHLSDFSIQGIEPYMRQGVRVGQVHGLLDVDAEMSGDFNHIMNFDLKGNSTVRNAVVTDDRGQMVMRARKTQAELKRLNLTEKVLHLGNVTGEGIASQFVIDKSGDNNFAYFSSSPQAAQRKAEHETGKDNTDTAKASEGGFKITIDRIRMSDMSMDMRDESLAVPFTYAVRNASVRADSVALDRSNDVSFAASMGRTGTVEARWRGKMDDINNQNLIANLTNVDLSEFSPYFSPMFAYNITGGNCTLVSQNVIKGGNITGTNRLTVMNCTVEKDNAMKTAEFNVPLKTALYVVKDKNGKIDIDLPVAGNINSPEFSYKKIIVKTLVNFLVKVGQAPFKALSGLFGGRENIDEVAFDPTVNTLSAENYSQLNEIAKMMEQRPELKATLTQEINYTDAMEIMALKLLKTDCYLASHAGKTAATLEPIDQDAIEKMAEKDSTLVAFANAAAANIDPSVAGKPVGKIAMAVCSARAVSVLDEYARTRQTVMAEYIKRILPGDSTRIVPLYAPYDATQDYKGKTMLKFKLNEE